MSGNCFSNAKKSKADNEFTLGIFGLDNAGKTTSIRCFQGENQDDVSPTVGFEKAKFTIDDFNVVIFDLGGGKGIRDIWKNYFPEVYGLIYVVDSSDIQRLPENKAVIAKLFSDPKIRGKPILLLANKMDDDNVLDESEILEELQIEDIVNEYKCPCRLEACSAKSGVGKNTDPAMRHGLLWLLTYIRENIATLGPRVTSDMDEDRIHQENERAQRRQRVNRIREQNERERRARGELSEDDNDPLAKPGATNPFRRLDTKALEDKAKAEKDRKKNMSDMPLHRSNETLPTYETTSRQTQRSNPLKPLAFEVPMNGNSSNIGRSNPSFLSSPQPARGVKLGDKNRPTSSRDDSFRGTRGEPLSSGYDDGFRSDRLGGEDSLRKPNSMQANPPWKKDPFVVDQTPTSYSSTRTQLKPLGNRPLQFNSDEERLPKERQSKMMPPVKRNQLAPSPWNDDHPTTSSINGRGNSSRFDMFVTQKNLMSADQLDSY